MVALRRDPQGLHVFDKPQKQQHSSTLGGGGGGGSLKRNVSLSYYNKKDSTIKDDGEDSGRCTLDSKDQKENNQNHNHQPTDATDGNKDDVFLENGGNNSQLKSNGVRNHSDEEAGLNGAGLNGEVYMNVDNSEPKRTSFRETDV